MKIAHISHSDISGGAARAAFRLHRALVAAEIDSKMYVANKASDDFRVVGPKGRLAKFSPRIRSLLAQILCRLCTTDRSTMRSLALSGSSMISQAESDGHDVINLHWIGGEAVGLKELARARRPLVWRVADMWPFCGAEHYSEIGPSARWRLGYQVTQPSFSTRCDIDRLIWKRKVKYIPKTIQLIATTTFVADSLKQSAIFSTSTVSVIPNVLDTQTFQPWPKALAREIFGLPQEVPIVAFGAMGGIVDPRKGWDLLEPALGRVAKEIGKVEAVVFGQSAPSGPPSLGMPVHWAGYIKDDVALALLYSAVDVMVVPSRQETFGQTASEAQSCGTPVVAFNTTGLPDVVQHCVSGYLAEPYSSEDLARGICWVLEDSERYAALSAATRERAVKLWSPEVIVPQYMQVYKAAIAAHAS